MTASSTEAVVRDLLGAIGSGDLSAALTKLDERCVVTASIALPWGGTRTGKSEFASILRTMGALFKVKMSDYEVYTDAGTATVRAAATFTARSSGRSTQTSIVELYEIHDGLITGMDVYYKDPQAIAALRDELSTS